MIQVDKGKLKFLKAGRAITVDVDREYRKGKAFTVKLEGSKSTRLRCQVLETFQMAEKCWRLTIKEDHSEDVWYLSGNPAGMRADYTQNPQKAARELNGAPIEAADKSGKWLAKHARQNGERDDQARREQAHRDRISRRSSNTSVSRIKWLSAPPASDIQAAVSEGASSRTPNDRAA